MAATRCAAWLAAASLALACGKDPVPELEAKRQALLDATQPKAAFWSEVERKGGLAKEKRAVDAELAATRARIAALGPELDPLAAALAQASGVNAQAAEALARNRGELARIEAEVAKREQALDGMAQRGRAAEPAP